MSNAFLYARVSHKDSELSGISIPDQVNAGLKYISNIPGVALSDRCFSHDSPGVFCDRAVSGWSRPFSMRPAGAELLRHITRGDHVVFYSVDRASRNLRDFGNTVWELERIGAYIHYVADQINSATAVGKFQLNMRAAAAQFFSDLISERTREALAIRRMINGHEPFAGKKRCKWVANPMLAVDVPAITVDRPVGRILQYERVSTEPQYISGLGLAHQSMANQKAAERLHQEHGGIIDRVFSDPAVSAFSKKFSDRKAGRELLEYVQPGDDIVIYRLDRAWRNPADAMEMAQQLMEKNVYLHFVSEGIRTDTRQGAEWINVLAAMAHMESSMRSTRVKRALDECRRQGRRIGGEIPVGWKVKEVKPGYQKLVLDPREISERCIVWVMKNELGMGPAKMDEALLALHCQKAKERAKLSHKKFWHTREALLTCEHLRSTIPVAVWNKCLNNARQAVETPIDRQYWYRPKFREEKMSIADLSYSLSSR